MRISYTVHGHSSEELRKAAIKIAAEFFKVNGSWVVNTMTVSAEAYDGFGDVILWSAEVTASDK